MRHLSFDLETTGLSGTDSQIVAIAVARDKRGTKDFQREVLTAEKLSEQEMVELFVNELKRLDSNSKIVTYNGDTFDWPFLVARSMEFDDYGDLTDELFQLKEKHGYDMFKDYGRDCEGNYLKLEELLRRNGLRHSVDCNGGKVPELVEEEKWGDIREYAKEDVVMTHKLFRKLEGENSEN